MNENEILVSIIIPVYNAEQYIKRCIDSVLMQSYHNWEVVLIDDGSKDLSGEMCDVISKSDARFITLHKENEGLGKARNDGLRIIHGDYVLFLDADDYFAHVDSIEKLVDISEKYNSDIIATNFIYDDKVEGSTFDEGIYKGAKAIRNILINLVGYTQNDKNHFNVSACTKMYNVKFLNKKNLFFPSERELIWEDLAFNFEAISKADSIYIMDYAYYHYCYNGSSTTHRYNSEKFNQIMIMYNYMKQRVQEKNLPSEAIIRLNNMFMGNIYTCIKLEVFFKNVNGINIVLNNIRNILNDNRLVELLSSLENSQFTLNQRIFNRFMKKKMVIMVYILALFQNIKKGNLIN